MAWEWEALTLGGVTKSILTPRSVEVTRNLNAASTIRVQLDAVAGVGGTDTIIRGWRQPVTGGQRVLRATGRNSQVTATAGEAGEVLTLAAHDAYGVLGNRSIGSPLTFTQIVPREIVLSLVAAQNGRENTGTYMDQTDTFAGGPPRDRTYERGKNVAETIKQLAEVDDGFFFRCDPYDGYEELAGWYFFSELLILYPDAGSDSDARFEWPGNLADVEANVEPPINYVFAFGAGDGDEQLYSQKYDQASIDAYGIFDKTQSFSDVIYQETLDQHALDLLMPAERRTFRVTTASTIGSTDLYVPSPWDDFDVGDTVQLSLRGTSEPLQYDGRLLVTSFTVTIDANGVERLSTLDLQEAPNA